MEDAEHVLTRLHALAARDPVPWMPAFADARAGHVEEPRADRRLGLELRHARADVGGRLPLAEAQAADAGLGRIGLERHLPAPERLAVAGHDVVARVPHAQRPVRTQVVDLVHHLRLHRVAVDVVFGAEHAGDLREAALFLRRDPHAEVAARNRREQHVAETKSLQLKRLLDLVRPLAPVPDVRRALEQVQVLGDRRILRGLLLERDAEAPPLHLGAVTTRQIAGRGLREEAVADAAGMAEAHHVRRPVQPHGPPPVGSHAEVQVDVPRRADDGQMASIPAPCSSEPSAAGFSAYWIQQPIFIDVW